VRSRFAGRLAARIAELGEIVQQVRADEADLPDAITLAHRLAGTAGSFGYQEAGEAAAAVDQALTRIRDGDDAWSEVESALAELAALAPAG
jgi:HPt (histidine-containing phosphotransfer) domain-containing protein